MSASRSAQRPEGPGVRRPSRARDGHLTTDRRDGKGKLPPRRGQSHPDFPAPEILPLFDAAEPPAIAERLRRTGTAVEHVDVQGVPHRIEPVVREPGDEARSIVRLAPPGAHAEGQATVADCGSWYECDCAEYRRDWECRHIFALIRVGRLADPLAVGRGRDGRTGGASC